MIEDTAEEEAVEEPRPLSRARRIGRRVGQAVYYSVVVGISVSVTWQITQQVFYPAVPETPRQWSTCEAGLKELLGGIEKAKRAADRQDGDMDEEAALNRFRIAISPSWAHRDVVGSLCQAPAHKRLLDAMDRLRYSEEHGVRKQAAELTALRRRVGEMAAEVLPQETP
jgi:hypothetical protein